METRTKIIIAISIFALLIISIVAFRQTYVAGKNQGVNAVVSNLSKVLGEDIGQRLSKKASLTDQEMNLLKVDIQNRMVKDFFAGKRYILNEVQRLKHDIKKDPKDSSRKLELALIYFKDNKINDAIKICSEVIKREPNNFLAYYLLFNIYLKDENADMVIDINKKIGEIAPDFMETHIPTAYMYLKKGFAPKASEELLKIPATKSLDLSTQRFAAQLYASTGMYEAAISQYKMLLEKDPRTTYILNIGIMNEKRGLLNEAQNAYREVISLSPIFSWAYNNLANIYLNDPAKINDALTLAKIAYALNPGDGFIQDTLGWTYYKLSDYDAAKLLLEKARINIPNSSYARFHLGMLYIKLKKPQEAKQELKLAISLGLNEDDAKLTQKTLSSL